jgi:hypothetical protein
MATAVVWDAYHRDKYEGTLFKRYPDGITIDLSNGIRYFAKNANIVTVEGEEKEEPESGTE